MISTRLITSLWDVPREWIFEYYLNITEKLTGESIKIKSIFNPSDKIPSMIIYFDGRTSQYKFKDFSSGYQGDAIRLVELLYNLTRDSAKDKIMFDYESYISKTDFSASTPVLAATRFKLSDYQIRHWNTNDKSYWTPYNINSRMLENYNIYPLEYYELTKDKGDFVMDRIRIEKEFIYGYFKEDGSLYKIYQPKVPAKKFLKISDYTQGLEQLQYDKKYLILVASLKDLLCFNLLDINNIEAIAPDAESTVLPKEFVEDIKMKYKKVLVLFDNDPTGKKYMQRYQEEFGFIPIEFENEKDIADSVKIHGIEATRNKLFPLLKQAL